MVEWIILVILVLLGAAQFVQWLVVRSQQILIDRQMELNKIQREFNGAVKDRLLAKPNQQATQ